MLLSHIFILLSHLATQYILTSTSALYNTDTRINTYTHSACSCLFCIHQKFLSGFIWVLFHVSMNYFVLLLFSDFMSSNISSVISMSAVNIWKKFLSVSICLMKFGEWFGPIMHNVIHKFDRLSLCSRFSSCVPRLCKYNKSLWINKNKQQK